jgi:hypothetical protein
MIHTKIGIKGRFKIDAIHKITGIRRELAPLQDNVILDQGLDRVAAGAWGNYCQVGTGNSTPATGQTSLDARVAGAGISSTSYTNRPASSPWTVDVEQTFNFGEGVAEGVLAEIGLAGSASSNLFSRALIKDSGGTPTTITILADEYLEVTYILTVNFKAGDTAWAFDISGTPYSGVVRAANADSQSLVTNLAESVLTAKAYDGAIGAEDGSPAGSSVSATVVNDAYVPSSYERTATITLALGTANFGGGISAISWKSRNSEYQASITPALVKTSSDVVTFDVKTSWARA